MQAQLVKWSAAVVGDTPPLGAWITRSETLYRSKVPNRLVRAAALLFRGWNWRYLHELDASQHPGCDEVVSIRPGEPPVTTYTRT